MDLGWASFRGLSVSSGPVRVPTLHVPLRGRVTCRDGRGAFEAGPGTMVLLAPGQDVVVVCEDAEILCVWFRGGALDTALAESASRGADDAPRGATEVPLDRDGRAEIAAALRAVVRSADVRGAEGGEARAGAETRLARTVAALVAPERGRGPGASREDERCRRVEAWLDEHLNEPMPLERLVALVGVSERTLRRDFVARRGKAPLSFVVDRRLAAARVRLVLADPDESVTRVAFDCGFAHLGRFAGAYRRVYGESPLATLRRPTSSSRPGPDPVPRAAALPVPAAPLHAAVRYRIEPAGVPR